MAGGGFVVSSAGSFSIHLRTSAARPFLFSHSIRSARSDGVASRDRFHFFEERGKLWLVQLPIKFEAEKIIGESDLLTHLQVLGKGVGALEFVALHRVAEQGAKGTGAKRGHFAQPFQDLARRLVFFRRVRANPKHGEIELVEIVAGLLAHRRGKMLLDLVVTALGAGEPSGDDVIRRAIAVRRRDLLERFPCGIELAKTKRGRREVKLAVEILRFEAGDLRAPRHGLGLVLFLARLRQDVKRGERIRAVLQHLARSERSAIEIVAARAFRRRA